MQKNIEFSEPPFARFLFADTKMAWLWLVIRLYVGWEWLSAGWEKFKNPLWAGTGAGAAVKGFLMAALAKTAGAHPDVQGWYGAFIRHIALPHVTLISNLVTYGELVIGFALIVGIFTGIAAFFGIFMNLNYLLAGAVSINPILLVLQVFLVMAWRIAGSYGLDRYVLPSLGTPWQHGTGFKN